MSEKIWWGHDLQIWDVGEQSDVISEGCSGTGTKGGSQVSPLPKPLLAPPHLLICRTAWHKREGGAEPARPNVEALPHSSSA